MSIRSRIRSFLYALVGVTAALMLAAPALGARHVVVQPGDTVKAIAARTGTTPLQIVLANRLRNADVLAVGQRLVIPDAAAGPAAPTSPSPSASAPVTSRHFVTVRPGDSFNAIAARLGISARDLAAANGVPLSDVLQVGRRLRIPGRTHPRPAPVATPPTSAAPAGMYMVRAGDTLDAIARRFGTSIAALVATNGLATPDRLTIGQRLRIPRTRPAPAPAQGTTPTPAVTPTPVTSATSDWGAHPSRAQVARMLNQSAMRFRVDPALVRAVAWQESTWWQGARSSAGAIGVMQLMPGTAAWLGPAFVGRPIDANSASDNIAAGTAYLAWLLRQTPSRDLAVGAYYQGLGSVQAHGLYGETKAYVASVYRNLGR